MAGVCVSCGPVHVSHSRSLLSDCQSTAAPVTAHKTTSQPVPAADNPEKYRQQTDRHAGPGSERAVDFCMIVLCV